MWIILELACSSRSFVSSSAASESSSSQPPGSSNLHMQMPPKTMTIKSAAAVPLKQMRICEQVESRSPKSFTQRTTGLALSAESAEMARPLGRPKAEGLPPSERLLFNLLVKEALCLLI